MFHRCDSALGNHRLMMKLIVKSDDTDRHFSSPTHIHIYNSTKPKLRIFPVLSKWIKSI